MPYTTVYKGFVFVEGDNPKAKRITKTKASLGGIGAQMKTLNAVKDRLIIDAKLSGCNCILDFKYGQKTALFAFDDVKFYGSGVCAILPEAEYSKIIKEKSQ